MNAPILSILIVNWNTEVILKNCLTSIYDDSESDHWQIVVVDNNSDDGSLTMLERDFPQVERVASRENTGFVQGNYLALERARGQYLLLLNTDTRVERGALGRLVEFMEAHPEAGAAGPKLLNRDGSLQLSCGISPSLATEFTNKLLLHNLFPFFKLGRWDHTEIREVGWVSGACLMMRRQTVEELGFLDPELFMFYEDLEWCLRIGRSGWKTFYEPSCRVLHLGGQSTRQNLAKMLVISQRSLFYLFEKHYGRTQLQVLRLLTLVEMGLRFLIWGLFFALIPSRRSEGRQRLRAYWEIAENTLLRKSYWAPVHAGS
jgi:GT2 family glycosyltransferase